MATTQLSGLASNFDWKSFIEQMMELERAPITRIEKEQATNTTRANALTDLNSKLASLKTAIGNLKEPAVFSARTASSSATTGAWSTSTEAGAATGAYKFTVSSLATAARRVGAADIGGALNSSANVSGLTLATMRTGAAATGGFFTVNGQQVELSTADSLQDVFDAISTATSGEVTAAYNATTDKVTLTSTSGDPITLGAANDTSNFLRVMKLANNSSGTITSSGTLGALKTTGTIATSGLRAAITNVDSGGAATFSINGVEISYNVNSDSIAGVIKRINAAGAGVTATYDSLNDRMTLTNNLPGNTGMAVSESGNGLLAAFGLTTGATVEAGTDAVFSVNDGPAQTASGNDLDAAAHGITGLQVSLSSTGTQTITVAADTESMRSKIDSFVSAFNSVQTFLDDKTRVTSANGKVTAAVLSANREVQAWGREMRQLAFATVSGMGLSMDRLDDMGIGFSGTSATLSVVDETKLSAALRDRPTDVEQFFTTSTTGFAAKFDTLLTRLAESADDQKTRLNETNTDLDKQITDIERRLAQQKELLTNSFINMETAQSKINNQASQITKAFFSNSSS